jgi:16S rRNA (adenine1518-N6/adenine1519-N6)-dimethyltransferase
MTNLPFEPIDARRLLRAAGLRPRKNLGQNFLIDERSLALVAAAAEIAPGETVLEIGAGLGGLTRHLARAAETVIAMEIDPALIPILRRVLAPFDNIRILEGDFLAQPVEELPGMENPGRYAVAANIPYYITSAIIRKLMEARQAPARMVLTVQREVAERICAEPGKMSLLAVSVQYYGRPRIAGRIPAEAFYPEPKVDSAIVRVDLDPAAGSDPAAADRLFRVARAGFSQKRKMLRNTLAAGLDLPVRMIEENLQAAGVDPRRRAETLSVEEWIRLAGVLLTA